LRSNGDHLQTAIATEFVKWNQDRQVSPTGFERPGAIRRIDVDAVVTLETHQNACSPRSTSPSASNFHFSSDALPAAIKDRRRR
jgi:hypothetical protein